MPDKQDIDSLKKNNLTIVTKLRFMAALAPAILLLAAAVIVGAFHFFGGLPGELHENEYAAARAAQGMETALYKMDWGRTQPDASQIVMDQQRGFISEIEIARNHIGSRDQAELIEKSPTTRVLYSTPCAPHRRATTASSPSCATCKAASPI